MGKAYLGIDHGTTRIRAVVRPLVAVLMLAPLCGFADFERLSCQAPEGESRDLKVGLWAWPAAMDFDGDGDLDLVVSCPCGPYNGIFLFRNPGGGPTPVFSRAERIGGKGYWSFVRGNSSRRGPNDVFLPGERHADFPRNGLLEPVRFGELPENVHTNDLQGNVWREVDFDGDGRLDVLVGTDDWSALRDALWGRGMRENYAPDGRWIGPSAPGNVYFARNLGAKGGKTAYATPELVRLADGSPLVTEGNPMPMCEDWDGDGDLDLICGCYVNTFTFYENVGTRTAPKYAAGRRVRAADGRPLAMDLARITPSAIDWDGDGRLDILCGDEDGRVAFIRGVPRPRGQPPVFEAPRYFRQEADDVNFGALSTPSGVDWDGDGDWDLVAGNTAGEIAFIENLSGPGAARPRWAEPVKLKAGGREIRFRAGANGSIQGPIERNWGYTCLTAADWDGDGLPDLMVNTITGDVVWFRNVGTRTKPALAPAEDVEVEWEGEQPRLGYGWYAPRHKANPKGLLTQWRTTPVMFDWNGDGLMDLVMLDHEGYLAFFERTRRDGRLALLPPKRVLADKDGRPLRLAPRPAGHSGRRKLAIADVNGDGRPDLLADGTNVDIYLNLGTDGAVTRFDDPFPAGRRKLSNHSTAPTTVDFDGDGRPELVVGAEDGYFYHLDLAPERFIGFGDSPAWSPDGGKIAFQRHRNGAFAIGVYDLKTHATAWVEPDEGQAAFPAWTPDGGLVYTFGNDTNTMFTGWKAKSAPGYGLRVRAADGMVRTLTSGRCRDYTPTVSPDGRTVYFTTTRHAAEVLTGRGVGSEIAAVPLAGGEVRRVARPAGGEDSAAAHPAVSPDGRFLAWSSLPCILDGGWTILVARTDDPSASCLLTDPDIIALSPRWHPDGRHVAFSGFRRGDPDWGVFVADVRTGASARLATGENPCFSPDGTKVCYACEGRLVIRAVTAADWPKGEGRDRLPRPAPRKIWSTGPVGGETTLTPPPADFAFGADSTFYLRVKGVWNGSAKLMLPVDLVYAEHPLGVLLAIREGGKAELSLRQTDRTYGPLYAAKRLKKGEPFEVVGIRHDGYIYLSLNREVTYRPYPIGFLSIENLRGIRLGRDCGGADGVTVESVEIGTGWPDDVVAARLRREVVR